MKTKAFTLIELLVVIAIIGVLSAVVMASLNTSRERANDSKRVQDMGQLRNALELYALDHDGAYPPPGSCYTSQGLSGNCTCDGVGDWTSDGGDVFVDMISPYIPQLPRDPKNDTEHCYIYGATPGGTSAVIWSKLGTGSNSDAGEVVGIAIGNISEAEIGAIVPGGTTFYPVSSNTGTSGNNGGGGPSLSCGGYPDCPATNDQSTCESYVGPSTALCKYTAASCGGSYTENRSCSDFDSNAPDCVSTAGCGTYVYANPEVEGSVDYCSGTGYTAPVQCSVTYPDYNDCISNAHPLNCAWSASSCDEIAGSCSQFTEGTPCTTAGCSWE